MASTRRRRAGGVPMAVIRLGVAAIVVLGAGVIGGARAQLRMGFYDESCPAAERIVGEYVRQHVGRVPTVAAALLRLHYHDCFVRGCDASILLNSTGNGGAAEKDAAPNQTLRGFDLIDRVKGLVEAACPGVVSCADVLALAARDAVAAIVSSRALATVAARRAHWPEPDDAEHALQGGPSWRVPTGRRDGTVSSMQEALAEIPSPAMSFPELAGLFATKGLSVRDLVWLSGAHTIGIAHCSSFADRLYNGGGGAGNANGNNTDPPPLDAAYAANLRERKCRTAGDGVVEMDPGSHLTFDLGYYRAVLRHRGLLRSDAALVTDAAARADIAGAVASPPEVFFQVFGRSMATLGAVQVKTGSDGEIRRNCAVVNSGH
ncbi:peroxidase 3 isoform X1 [Oryza sativa Japonica Group]|uniref:peroxidase 3 isoform X1 n=1 Tax=Oryza sativa subsp. japonica TaxID=39947 RepID=UPI0007755B25|nr:peroxidase 3 isoform X1 [Oryza sativa Japonica Group]